MIARIFIRCAFFHVLEGHQHSSTFRFNISGSEDMSFHTECELIKHIKKIEGFALQVEEFTDIDSLSVLPTFLRCTYNKLKNK
jgi:hypothetical protein